MDTNSPINKESTNEINHSLDKIVEILQQTITFALPSFKLCPDVVYFTFIFIKVSFIRKITTFYDMQHIWECIYNYICDMFMFI